MVKGGGCLDDRRCGQDQRSDHQKFLQGDATGNLGAKSKLFHFFPIVVRQRQFTEKVEAFDGQFSVGSARLTRPSEPRQLVPRDGNFAGALAGKCNGLPNRWQYPRPRRNTAGLQGSPDALFQASAW
jgi:hypothetical protein